MLIFSSKDDELCENLRFEKFAVTGHRPGAVRSTEMIKLSLKRQGPKERNLRSAIFNELQDMGMVLI